MLETLWPPSTLQIRAGGLRIVAITDEHLPHVCTITFADIYGDTIPDHAFTWLFTSTPVAAAQFRWSNRANMSSKEWSLDLAAFNEHTGEFIGAIDLRSTNFATTRCISTGSWVLHKHQGRGYGTTIRRAICEYGLVTLGATVMQPVWIASNHASAAVSAKVGSRVAESVTAPAGPNGTPLPAVLAELRRDDYPPTPAGPPAWHPAGMATNPASAAVSAKVGAGGAGSAPAPAGPNGTPLPAGLAELRRDDSAPNPDVVITGHTPSLHEFLTGERPGPAPSE
jgi:acetyltransferase, GNAT family